MIATSNAVTKTLTVSLTSKCLPDTKTMFTVKDMTNLTAITGLVAPSSLKPSIKERTKSTVKGTMYSYDADPGRDPTIPLSCLPLLSLEEYPPFNRPNRQQRLLFILVPNRLHTPPLLSTPLVTLKLRFTWHYLHVLLHPLKLVEMSVPCSVKLSVLLHPFTE